MTPLSYRGCLTYHLPAAVVKLAKEETFPDGMTNPDESRDAGPPKVGVSFGFAKTSSLSKKLNDSRLRERSTKADEEEKDFVLEVNRKGIAGTKPKEVKKELVIPCAGNKYRLTPAEDDPAAAAAAREILEESNRWLEKKNEEREDLPNANLTIHLSAEEKEKAALDQDLGHRAEVSTLDDYEAVPVEGFGMGMLRGMGFKTGEGIGGFKKASVACIEPNIRPKGLGLGAQRPNTGGGTGSQSRNGGPDEDLTLKKGSHIRVETGVHRGCYGKVEGLDEETARVVVKLTVGGDSVSISENVVKVVTKDEYKKYSRIINKDEYDKYEKKQKEREVEWDRSRGKRDRSRSRSRSPAPKASKKGSYSDRDSRRGRERGPTWLRPQLKVRLIDEDYKKGRYYNSKVLVEDIVSPYSCVVRTDSGKILEDVDPHLCETIIPKKELSIVMIVRGKKKGQLGEILGRDKKSSRAAIQLLPDKDEVLKMDYDDICEYVGDADTF